MDSQRIKEIWKENVVQQIDNYTDSEITLIVLKTVRRAINRSYPGIIFWSILIFFCLLCVWIMMKYTSPQLQTYGYALIVAIMVLIFGAVCISEWGRRRAQRYSFDMPLKEWIELRIRDFDKGIKRSGKWFWRFGLGITLLLLFCLIYILTVGFSFKILLIQLISGLTSLFIASIISNRISMKRMIETRQQLQELYNQLQDSEELSK